MGDRWQARVDFNKWSPVCLSMRRAYLRCGTKDLCLPFLIGALSQGKQYPKPAMFAACLIYNDDCMYMTERTESGDRDGDEWGKVEEVDVDTEVKEEGYTMAKEGRLGGGSRDKYKGKRDS
ncbi:hypothetical protein ANTQUA_LOCUS10275 [Anthophora quadrimaculata]